MGIGVLPLWLVQLLGGCGGIIALLFSKQFREPFNKNYSRAMDLNGVKQRPLMAAAASGMLFMDSLWIWYNPKKALTKTQFINWEMVERAMQHGRGLIILSPHLGGFEIIPRYIAQHFPATIMFRPARQEWLNEIVVSGRAYPNMNFVPANLHGVRAMTRALKEGVQLHYFLIKFQLVAMEYGPLFLSKTPIQLPCPLDWLIAIKLRLSYFLQFVNYLVRVGKLRFVCWILSQRILKKLQCKWIKRSRKLSLKRPNNLFGRITATNTLKAPCYRQKTNLYDELVAHLF